MLHPHLTSHYPEYYQPLFSFTFTRKLKSVVIPIPRAARKKSPNGIYHIMLRGINRQTIFEDDQDRTKFLEVLKKYKEMSYFQLYSYCLMDNHIHLLMKESENISNVVKRISSSYVYWYNLRYERCGHLFQERFKSENIDSMRYFLTVLRYIHQNPLKAGISTSIYDCEWTSVHEYLGKATLVDADYPLQFFSSDHKQALILFKEFMEKPNDDQCLEDIVKVRLTDDEVKKYLLELGVSNVSGLQHVEKEVRDNILFELKETYGVSLRQIARVTGISKSVIQRAGK